MLETGDFGGDKLGVQDPVPDNCKQLPPNVGGEAEDAAPALSSLADTVKLGFYRLSLPSSSSSARRGDGMILMSRRTRTKI